MNNFRELKVWQRAIGLATKIYNLSNKFPEKEKCGLSSQLQRASVSVSSNIAEGSGRQTKPDFKLFLSSLGSLYEIESQLIIAKNLKYLDESDFESTLKEIVEIQKMIYSLRSKF